MIGRAPSPRAGAITSAAFEAVFEAEYPAVVRVAARVLLDLGAAEDVAQDVFLALHVRYPEGHASAAGWLRVAAAHLALNRLRDDRRRQQREYATDEPRGGAESPEMAVIQTETNREVLAALGRLKRAHGTLLALRYSGFSYAEVAESLGIPVDQVGTRLRRAEAALRKEISRE